MQFTLEKYKIFPYVAWALVFGFAFFTYTLASELSDTYASLDSNTEWTC